MNTPSVKREDIKKLLEEGHTKRKIADILGVSYATIKKHSTGLKSIVSNTKYQCRTCPTTGKENFYSESAYKCKTCWNKYTVKKGKDKIQAYMESRGGAQCSRCGYDRYVGALDFHHRDPAQKDPTWSRGWSLDKLKKELDKCDIVCANCHREIHAEMRGDTLWVGGSSPSGQAKLGVDKDVN